MEKKTIWVKHKVSGQTIQLVEKEGKALLKSPSWVQVTMTPKGAVPYDAKAEKKVVKTGE